MGGQHGVLNRVMGVLGGRTPPPRHPVEAAPVALEKFGEGVAVTGEVGAQQFIVTACRGKVHGADVNHPATPGHFTRGGGS